MRGLGFAFGLALQPLLMAQVITTVAGAPWAFRGDGGPAINAPLGVMNGVAVDSSGNVFAADNGNHLVVKISPNGSLSVVAGNGLLGFSGDGGPATSASLNSPTGVAVDAAGNLYIADMGNSRVRKVSGGTISTVTGNGSQGFSGDGGSATSASLNQPTGVAVDAAGNVYIADTNNHRVRKVSDGTITTVAGNGTSGFSGDGGPASSAFLSYPLDVSVDSAGDLYIADTYNHRVRKVSGGTITTVAGNGTPGFSRDGSPATSASLVHPAGVAVDGFGNLYIAARGLFSVRKVSGGTITTVAGTGTPGFSGDGGSASSAWLSYPEGVAVDAAGNLYIADAGNRRIRRVSGGTIATVAGNGRFKFSGDGGPATSAAVQPSGVTVDAAGNLYISDMSNYHVRKVSGGTISSVAGNGVPGFSGDGGAAISASLAEPFGMAVDAAGNLYIADAENHRIRKLSGGTITTVAGGGSAGDGGPATSASLMGPKDVAVDAAGNLYIADYGHQRIRKVSDGTISTVAGNGTQGFSGDGGPAASAALSNPVGVAVDAAGNLYIADFGNRRIRKVSRGTISTVAGNGTPGFSGDGGPATNASLDNPFGVAVDAAGNLYIADPGNGRVRKVSGGTISTVAGNGTQGFSGDGGPATSASLVSPKLAVDAAGNVYVADTGNNRIRKILSSPPSFSVLPSSLSMSLPSGSDVPATRQVAVASEVIGLAWSAQASESWLSVSPASGNVPGIITVSADTSSLALGTYRGTITVNAPLASPTSQTVSVELTVTSQLAPQLAVEPGAILVEIPANSGNPPQQTLRIRNKGGGGTLRWTAQGEVLGAGNWLTVLSTSGSASGRTTAAVPVRLNVAALQPGIYSGLVQVNSSEVNQRQAVPVTLLLSQQAKTILTTLRSMNFTAVEGTRTTPAQSLGILNVGQGTMDWTVRASTLGGGSWLRVTPDRGQSQAGGPNPPLLVVQADPSALSAGLYTGLLRIDAPGANNSPNVVTVNFEVLAAGASRGVQVQPPQLIFTAQAGTSSPSSQTIRLTTPRGSGVEARPGLITLEGGDWVQILPTNLVLSDGDPRSVVVRPNVTGLAPGFYRAALTYQFSDGSDPQVVDIFFQVTGATQGAASRFGAEAGCTPQKLIAADHALGRSFTATAGLGTSLEVQVIDDCGSPVFDATVVASFSNNDPPLTLTSLSNGTYAGTWRPATASPQVTVTLRTSQGTLSTETRAAGRVQDNAQAPALFSGGIVNAASFASGTALAPGSIVSVFGRNLANATAVATSTPLPATLGGAVLQIGGTDVPLFYAANGQINALLPFEMAPATRQQALVRGTNTITLPETITIAPVRPGVFTINQQGTGQGAILDARGRLADSGARVAAGETVQVFCTGLGATQLAVRSGDAAPAAEPLARVTTIPAATVGGVAARVSFAGLAPGFVGLYQVNVEIPAGLAAGDAVSLVLSQNGVPSNTVTLAVR